MFGGSFNPTPLLHCLIISNVKKLFYRRSNQSVHSVMLLTGYYSWRRKSGPTKGSWFIQALHAVIQQNKSHLDRLDFVSLLTRVNYKVAYELESSAKKEDWNHKKQVPSIVSMLRKDLFLAPKLQ